MTEVKKYNQSHSFNILSKKLLFCLLSAFLSNIYSHQPLPFKSTAKRELNQENKKATILASRAKKKKLIVSGTIMIAISLIGFILYGIKSYNLRTLEGLARIDKTNTKLFPSKHIKLEDIKKLQPLIGNLEQENNWLKDKIESQNIKFDLEKTNAIKASTNAFKSTLTGSILVVARDYRKKNNISDHHNFDLDNQLKGILLKYKEIGDLFDSKKSTQVVGGKTRIIFAGEKKLFPFNEFIKKIDDSYGCLLQNKVEALAKQAKHSYSVKDLEVIFFMMIEAQQKKMVDLEERINKIQTTSDMVSEQELNFQKEIQKELGSLAIIWDVWSTLVNEYHCYGLTIQAINSIFKRLNQNIQITPLSLHGKVYWLVEDLREKAYDNLAVKEGGGEVHTSNNVGNQLRDMANLQNQDIGSVDDFGFSFFTSSYKRKFVKTFNGKEIIKLVADYLVSNHKKLDNITLNLEEYREYCNKRLKESGYNIEENKHKPYRMKEHPTIKGEYITTLNLKVLICYLIDIGILVPV